MVRGPFVSAQYRLGSEATRREAYAHVLPEAFFTEEHVQNRHRMWNHILENPRAEWSIRIAECNGQIIGFALR